MASSTPTEAFAAFPRGNTDPPRSGVQLCYPRHMEEADPLRAAAFAARTGDAAATRELLTAIAPHMLKVVRMVLGREDRDVEDVLQDALVAAIHALPSFRGESTVLHFVRSVAIRRALDHKRSRARRGEHVELAEEMLDASGSPKASVIAARRRAAFRAVLESLRPEQAEAFAHRVLLGDSIEEIAIATGAPVETVRSRLRLAKAALRARIEKDPTLLELSEISDDDSP